MKRRPSLLKKIWRKLRGSKAIVPAPRARKVMPSLEPLEGRISPAALINPTTLMYKDIGGDIVTVKFTKSIFNLSTAIGNLASANNVFKFSDGTNPTANAVTTTTFNAATAPEEQLLLIDLTQAPSSGGINLATGTGLAVTATKTGGIANVDVGYINATGLPLAAVSVAGDLGQIDAGASTAATGLASLNVKTWGVRSPSETQPVTGRSTTSNVTGAIGSITITGDMTNASLIVTSNSLPLGLGKIGTLTIGGSLRGGATDGTGLISTLSDIGAVKIGTLPTDGIFGGAGKNSGRIEAVGKIASLTISGGITGAGGIASGSVSASSTLGPVNLVKGSLTGGGAKDAGSISGGGIGTVTIFGSLVGTGFEGTGVINSTADIGLVKIGTAITDGIQGGSGKNSGHIQATGKIAGLTVSGGITGAGGPGSGSVDAGGAIGPINLVKGSLTGGSAKDSGSISGGGIGTVNIFGSILGGGDAGAGVISSTLTIGAVKIGGDIDGRTGATANSIGVAGLRAAGTMGTITVVGTIFGGPQAKSGFIDGGADLGAIVVKAIAGGAGQNSGTITAGGKIASITVAQDVIGDGGVGSGSIFSGIDPLLLGDIGAVKIGGKLWGGTQDDSGTISSGGKIASVTIGPAVAPAIRPLLLKGGAGNFSGGIFSRGALGAVTITGDVEGGGGAFSGSIWSHDLVNGAIESAGDLGAVNIAGHLKGGGSNDSGVIRADGKLTSATTGDLLGAGGVRSGSIRAGQGIINGGTGAITIKGVMTSGAGPQTGAIIAEGRIASVLITGNVTGGSIRAGDDIGSITVGSLAASANVTGGAQFSARGQALQGATTDLAIGTINIYGNVANARIRAGYDTTLTNAVNADAQIGAVYVKGSWTASDLFAGVIDGGAAGFGTTGDVKIPGFDNPKIISQIASITIAGLGITTGNVVVGTSGSTTDHFGFTAQKIGAMKIGPATVAFSAAPNESFELLAINSTNDVTAREVPL
jgi:hypothetical protein